MSLFKLKFSAPIQTVSLHQCEEGGYALATSLSTGMVSVHFLPDAEQWDALEGTETMVPNSKFLDIGLDGVFPSCRLLSWLDSGHLFGVISRAVPMNPTRSLYSKLQYHSSSETLIEFEVERKKDELSGDGLCKFYCMLNLAYQIIPEKSVLAIAKHPSKNELVVEFEDGSLSSYGSQKGLFQDEASYSLRSLSYPSVWIQVLLTDSCKRAIIALDAEGRLQLGSRIICTDCTSFTTHVTTIGVKKVSHVLYTTKQDLLHIVNLEEALGPESSSGIVQDLSNLSLKKKDETTTLQNPHRKSMRKDILKEHTIWERSARLIASIGGSGAAVILQTVRGNLETLYPRNLVLGSIVATLCDSKFNEALLLARRHHINLNLIVDFKGWEAFVPCAVEFVKQVKNLSYITEFICAVSAGNFVDCIYRDLLLPYVKEIGDLNMSAEYSSDLRQEIPNQGLKVRSVMHAIRKALQAEVKASPKRELCILTTMARSDPPELEEALQKIKKLREEELNFVMEAEMENSDKRLNAEDALKHLLWLSDPESLFNAALGIYDLHLAAMVANIAQRDPKEFLPLLQELEQMPPPVMKYTIDLKLRRFERALKNLASAGDSHFQECLDLLKKNPQLFALGKQLFQSGSQRTSIMEAWGDYLFADEKFEEAGCAYCSCSQLEKALAAYRAGGLWQYALVMGGMLNFSSSEMLTLAQELRDELHALGRPGEAAKVALEYCKDIEDAINLFIESREWMEAVRVVIAYGKPQLINAVIEPSALDCAASYASDFEEGLEKLGKYLARYNAVKQRRLLLEIKLKNDASEDIEDDVASEASSNLSGMSAYTTGYGSL
jgi:elongator complex protein 1